MGERGISSINRFQHWTSQRRGRAAAVVAIPTAVVVFGASIAAGLSVGTAAAVAAGLGLVVAVTAALVVWAVLGQDPELRDLDAADTAAVKRATSSVAGAVAIRPDPRLHAVATRAARLQLRLILRLRPWTIGIGLVLAAVDVHLAVQGDWWRLTQLFVPVGIVALTVTVPSRLRGALDALEAPAISAAGPPAPPAPRATP